MARSSTEAEFRLRQMSFFVKLILDVLKVIQKQIMQLYCDNKSLYTPCISLGLPFGSLFFFLIFVIVCISSMTFPSYLSKD